MTEPRHVSWFLRVVDRHEASGQWVRNEEESCSDVLPWLQPDKDQLYIVTNFKTSTRFLPQRPRWTGVYFHPETPQFDFVHQDKHNNTLHSTAAIKTSQYFANIFVNECRKSTNKITCPETEKSLLHHTCPEDTDNPDVNFKQVYFFSWSDREFGWWLWVTLTWFGWTTINDEKQANSCDLWDVILGMHFTGMKSNKLYNHWVWMRIPDNLWQMTSSWTELQSAFLPLINKWPLDP